MISPAGCRRLPTRRGCARALRFVHEDERGMSLTEILVGTAISVLVMVGITSAIFTTNDLQLRADDRNRISGALSVVSLVLDRDGAMATASAPARSQTASTACTNDIDLGFLESGAAVRFRATAAGTDGPLWFQRVSGAGTRTIAKQVASCTWHAVQDAGGRWSLSVTLTIAGGSGESATRVLRAAPRLW